MKDADEIVEKPVGTERGLFVEIGAFDIAAIGPSAFKGTKLTIAVVFGKQFLIGDIVVTTDVGVE